MARARTGAADVDTVSAIVEGLLRTAHAIAAPWWLDLAAGGDAKLTASERETIAKLRRACERPETFADVRKLLLRLIRHAEVLAVDKDFVGARQAAAAARGMLGLVPDAGLMRMLDAADKRIPAPRPEEAAAARDRSPWPAAFEAELAATARRLAEAGAAAYRAAGCRPGRDTLARSIRAMAGILSPPDLAKALDRVRELTPTVEPESGLTVFLRTVGTARAFREGLPYFVDPGQRAFDAEKHDPFVIPVLPGDLVTIAIDEPYTADDFGGRSYVIALHARFEWAGPRDEGPLLRPREGAGRSAPDSCPRRSRRRNRTRRSLSSAGTASRTRPSGRTRPTSICRRPRTARSTFRASAT